MSEVKGFDSFLERDGVVKVIVTKKKYRVKPFCIVPIFDGEIKDYRRFPAGLPKKDESLADKLTAKYFPNPDEQVFIDHNKELKKSNDADFALLMMLLAQHPLVVKSQSEIVPGVTVAYLHDAEHEANINIKASRVEFKAMAKVVDMSAENQRRMMFYFGEDPDKLSPSVLESTLYARAKAEPEKIIEFYEDPDAEIVTMINIMKKEGIITRNKGTYYYGKIYLGQDIREVVSWSKEDKNSEPFGAMRKLLKSKLVTLDD